MQIPENLLYSKSHEWVKKLDGGNVQIGITDYAQKKLGDIVFVNLCRQGDKLTAQGPIGDVESIKSVSDIYSPIAGTVINVNQSVLDDPSLINGDPYGAWLVELSADGVAGGLVTAAEYAKIVEKDN